MPISLPTTLKGAWYMAGFADEFAPGVIVARTLLGQALALFRTADGGICALADRCPHRFAPLSAGTVCDGGLSIQCAYHGLRFGADGRCVHNPHGNGHIPKASEVPAWVVREQDRLVWLWAGDAALADASLIPDCSAVTAAPDDATVRGHMPTACAYQLLVDNILDLTHADYLHAGLLGSGAITRTKPQLSEPGPRSVHIAWHSSGDLAPGAFDAHLREQGRPSEQWTEVTWTAPGCMQLHVGATLMGEARERGVDTLNLHLVTPETATTCHYWYWTTRNFAVDPQANAQISSIVRHAFSQQDKPMLEAQQARIGGAEFWSLKPVLLPGDAGAVRVRRKLQQLVAQEQST
jgi:phenylpropionate dioxygenase-like ring-hydroxylating dioxygenase large terminal subunit